MGTSSSKPVEDSTDPPSSPTSSSSPSNTTLFFFGIGILTIFAGMYYYLSDSKTVLDEMDDGHTDPV